MGWPTRSDYINALQRLPAVFRDAAFQAGAVPADARDRLGRPSPASGSFAVVFKLRVAGADTALRGYISPRHARRAERHYGVLRDYLKQRRPSCLVPFEYRPSFIQVVDEWYPVLTMEWVQGQNLWDWAAEQVANRSAGALREAADRWIELVGELKRYQIAHGDLQHGNVLVVNGALKLVDYDGMFVPAFQGDEAGAVEDGVPAYQHPRRPEQTTRSPALDDFSAWVILIALRALASDPGLWGRYVEETDNENLLFSPEDIQEPDRPGNLWESLRQSGDPQVVEWSRRLRESLDRPFAEIPPFEVDPFRPLREARDPDEIVRLASELALAGRDLPDDLARKLTAAREQCAARDEVAGALAAGNVRRAVAYLDEQLLAYWPKLLERGRLARQQVAWLDEIQKLVRETRDGRDLLRGWLRLRLSLAGIPEAERLGKVAESWRRRLECLEALQAELAKSPPSEAAVARAWKELCGAGNHPEAAGLKDRAELAGKYALKVPTVRDLAAKPPGEQVDRALCGAWDEGGLEGCDEVIPLRPAVEKARGRVRLLDRLGTLVKGDGTDEQIRAIVDALPPDYPYELKGSLEEIRKQEVARKKLREALGRVPLSHVKLAEAWEACCDAGVAPPEPAVLELCVGAVRRRDCLRRVETALDPTLPPDEQDRRWLEAWDDTLLRDCNDALRHRARHAETRTRIRVWTKLDRAARSGDAVRACRIARRPLLARYPPVQRLRQELPRLFEQGDRAERILGALGKGDDEDVRVVLHLPCVAGLPRKFRPFRGRIVSVIAAALAEGELFPGDPPYRIDEGGTLLTLRWTGWYWPEFGHPERVCRVGLHPERFLEAPSEDPEGTYRPGERACRSGFTLPLPEGVRSLFVTVWPVVELDPDLFGQKEVVGPALRIGPVALAGGAGRNGSGGSWLSAVFGFLGKKS